MSQIKKQLRNPIVQQYVLEIALPLVGYLFFDWSLTIIAVFYLIDFLASEVARNRRVYKVYRQNQNNSISNFVLSAIGGGLIFLAVSVLSWFIFTDVYADNLDFFYAEIIEFAKGEMWLLIPIVYLVYHLKDVMMFFAPRRFLNRDYQKMVKYQLLELIILLALISGGLLLWRYMQVDDIVAIIIFLVIKIGYDILIARTLDQKYVIKS